MRVTIGVRLGLVKSGPTATTPPPIEPPSDEAVPSWVQPEKVLRLADLPSCKTVPVEVIPPEREGPPRVRGEMVWLHKTAPTLVIEGRPDVSPEDHAAGRRR